MRRARRPCGRPDGRIDGPPLAGSPAPSCQAVGERRLADALGADHQPGVMHPATRERLVNSASAASWPTGDRPRAAPRNLPADRVRQPPARTARRRGSWVQTLQDGFPDILGHHRLGLARVDDDAALRILLGDIEKGTADRSCSISWPSKRSGAPALPRPGAGQSLIGRKIEHERQMRHEAPRVTRSSALISPGGTPAVRPDRRASN